MLGERAGLVCTAMMHRSLTGYLQLCCSLVLLGLAGWGGISCDGSVAGAKQPCSTGIHQQDDCTSAENLSLGIWPVSLGLQ